MKLVADFNSLDAAGRLTLTVDDILDGVGVPYLGERVELDDLQGLVARAVISEIEDDLIDVLVDLPSLTAAAPTLVYRGEAAIPRWNSRQLEVA